MINTKPAALSGLLYAVGALYFWCDEKIGCLSGFNTAHTADMQVLKGRIFGKFGNKAQGSLSGRTHNSNIRRHIFCFTCNKADGENIYCSLTVNAFLKVIRSYVHGVHGGVIFLPPLNDTPRKIALSSYLRRAGQRRSFQCSCLVNAYSVPAFAALRQSLPA